MTWQRARSPKLKERRRQVILGTAARFLIRQSYPDISLAEIAKGAGLAPSALYRYFPSKEAIFFQLYLQALFGWVGETWAHLERYAGHNDGGAVAAVLSESLLRHPDLVRICPLVPGFLAGGLESKFREPLVVKEWEVRQPMVQSILRALPSLSENQGENIVAVFLAMVAGFDPVKNKAAFAGRPEGWLEQFSGIFRAYMRGQMLEIVDRSKA